MRKHMQFQGFFVLLCYRDDFSVFCMVQRCLIRAQNINFYLSSAPVSDPVFRNFYFSIQFFFSFLSRCSVASDNTSMINLGTPRKFVALRFLMSQLMETSGITGLSPFSCCLKTTHLFFSVTILIPLVQDVCCKISSCILSGWRRTGGRTTGRNLCNRRIRFCGRLRGAGFLLPAASGHSGGVSAANTGGVTLRRQP